MIPGAVPHALAEVIAPHLDKNSMEIQSFPPKKDLFVNTIPTSYRDQLASQMSPESDQGSLLFTCASLANQTLLVDLQGFAPNLLRSPRCREAGSRHGHDQFITRLPQSKRPSNRPR